MHGNKMRLYLINPTNPLVSLANFKESRWNRFRVWKPLGLLVLAGLTTVDEMRRIVEGTGWRIARFFDSDRSVYIAVLEKERPS